MVSAVLSGLGFGLFMAISVGPAIFAILKYSISYGWRAGISFVLGVSLSDTLYVSLANLASTWLADLMQHERIIGYTGSLLFVGIGTYGFFKKIRVTRHNRDTATVSQRDYWKIFSSGFFLNTFNPGVILTWITATAAISGTSGSYRFLFFISCLSLILGLDFLKVFLAQRIRSRLTPRNIVYLNRISAIFLGVIGIFLFIKIFFNIEIAGV